MIACAAPDGDLGVAVRLSGWLDCTARALGENGFQAFAGGPVAAGLLSGLVTIFVALIGYGMILGRTPSLRDGISWAVRLGVVLALVTGWPAFQTLVYRVAVDAPGEVAAVLLPSVGLPVEDVEARVQLAYDTIRLGSTRSVAERIAPDANAGASVQQQPGAPQPLRPINPATAAQPQTASLFAVATVGVLAATRLAAGFLLAVAPLAILALLFDATLGLFSGWLRALAGAALAQLAALVVSATGLVAIEGELAHLQAAEIGAVAPATVDPQALATMVLFTGAAMIAALLASARMAGALRLDPFAWTGSATTERRCAVASLAAENRLGIAPGDGSVRGVAPTGERSRAGAVADALAATTHREQASLGRDGTSGSSGLVGARRLTVRSDAADRADMLSPALGAAGRRTTPRRIRSAGRRDERR